MSIEEETGHLRPHTQTEATHPNGGNTPKGWQHTQEVATHLKGGNTPKRWKEDGRTRSKSLFFTFGGSILPWNKIKIVVKQMQNTDLWYWRKKIEAWQENVDFEKKKRQ